MIKRLKIVSVACAAVLGLALVGCGSNGRVSGQSVLPSAKAVSAPSVTIQTYAQIQTALSEDGEILSVTAKSIEDSDILSLSYKLKRNDLKNEFLSFHLKTQDIMLVRPRGGTITSCLCYGDVHTADTLSPQQIRSLDKLFDDTKKEIGVDALVAEYLEISHPDGWPSDWPPESRTVN